MTIKLNLMKLIILFAIIHLLLGSNASAQWTAVNNGLNNWYVVPLSVSGVNIFAGTNGGGVFLSTDNGSSWTSVNNGLNHLDVFSLATNGTIFSQELVVEVYFFHLTMGLRGLL